MPECINTTERMKKKTLILYIMSLLTLVPAAKAQVSVKASMDSAEILLGEQTAMRIKVVHPSGQTPVFPEDLGNLLKKGIEKVGRARVSSEDDIPDKGLTTTECIYTLTSFDPALYYIPSLSVKVGGRIYPTQQLALKVNDIKVDTVHTDKYFGPKEITDPAYTWRDWMKLFVVSLLLVIFIAASLYTGFRFKRSAHRKPAPKKKADVLLPHKEAEMAIEKLKEEYGHDALTSKDYYTDLVNILKRYATKRYGFKAGEMTSYELVEHLIAAQEEEQRKAAAEGTQQNAAEKPLLRQEPDYTELREILATADLTKFAKLKTGISEDERNIHRLSAYIEITKSDRLPAATQAEDADEETETHRNPDIKAGALFIAALILTVLTASAAVYIIRELLL